MDFKDLIRVARRRWKTIVSLFLVGIAAGAALSYTSTPTYHSTARVFISTDVSNTADVFYAASFGATRVQSYADLATSTELMGRVVRKLDLNLTPSELASKISASVETNTVLIDIEAKDPSARVAQQIAQAEAEELSSYLGEIETPAGKSLNPVKATITDRAQFDGSPVSPRTLLNVIIGGVVGLLLGCALALVRDLLDSTVKAPEDVEAVTTVPIMAHIAYDPTVPKSPLLLSGRSHSARAEAFRMLRTNLQFLDLDSDPRSFVVTSAVPAEGKTSTSTNLAISLSQAGKRVLLVDGDLRRPRIARMLGLESAVGITTILVGRSDLKSTIQLHQDSGVHFLAGGPIPPNPTEILQSQVTRNLFSALRDTYDAVIIDAPPLLPVADAAIMATDVDGAILVVRHGKTTREQLRHAMNRIDQVGARPLGVVVNMTPRRGGKSYDYGYGGDYDYVHPELVRATVGKSRAT